MRGSFSPNTDKKGCILQHIINVSCKGVFHHIIPNKPHFRRKKIELHVFVAAVNMCICVYWPPVVKVDKAAEPEATRVDYEIGTKINKKGAVKVDKADEPKTISVDYELDKKPNQKGTSMHRCIKSFYTICMYDELRKSKSFGFPSEFFLPASKKRKVQKRTEAIDTTLPDCKEMGKGNVKVKKQKEEKRTRSGKIIMVST